MASSQTLTIPYWICEGGSGSSYWQIGYSGSATVSVSRSSGSTKATVSVSASVYTKGGDTSSWTLYVKVGSNATVSSTFSGGTYHAPQGTYSASKSTEVSVGDEAGTLTVQVWIGINASSASSGQTSVVKTTDSLSYDSRGGGIITSCSNMTIGSAVNIGWTAYSTSMYYWMKFECGSFSEWSARITASSTGAQTFTNYTVPTSIANSISSKSTSADVKVSLVTYSDSEGTMEIGRSSTTVKVYTTQAQAATIQSNWTLKETNTSNPFKTSTKDIGGDGTYRFVKNVSKLKLTVYAYGAYGSVPYYLSGGFNALTFSNAYFSKTGSKDSSGNYDLYKAEITFTPNNDGSAHWWWFYVHDSRGYSTPMVADSSGVFTVKSDSSGNVYMLLNVADYDKPQVIDLKVNISGTSISIVPTTKVYSVLATDGSTQLNTIKAYRLTRTKLSNSSSTNIVNDTSKCSYDTASPTYSDKLTDIDTESYSYTLTVQDQMGTATRTETTAVVTLSLYKGGKGAAFFKEADANGLSIKGDTTILAPSTGNNICGIYENSSGNYTVIGLNDPKNTVRMTVEFRDIGGSVPELIGWDNAHGSYTFRASYNDAYMPGWKNIGSASTPVYFNGDGKPVACGNIVPTITSIAAWASKGSAMRPVYFDSSGVPQACNMFTGSSNAMFYIIDEVIDVGTVYSYNYGSSYNKYTEVYKAFTNVPSGYKAIAVAGFWIQALNNGSYTYDIAYCLSVLDCCVSSDQSKVYICVGNAGESAQTVRATVRVLCVYTG